MANKEKTEKILDFEDDGDLILNDIRESVALSPENARFSVSAGGLVSLDLNSERYGEEHFERVVILRAFPIEAPDEYICVRTPDTKDEHGKEIGMIRRLGDFPEEQTELINRELNVYYFTPEVTKIYGKKEKFGNEYWDVETTAGRYELIVSNPFRNIRCLNDGRVFIYDMDGNAFVIPDHKKLDNQSFKILDAYL